MSDKRKRYYTNIDGTTKATGEFEVVVGMPRREVGKEYARKCLEAAERVARSLFSCGDNQETCQTEIMYLPLFSYQKNRDRHSGDILFSCLVFVQFTDPLDDELGDYAIIALWNIGVAYLMSYLEEVRLENITRS